MKSVTRIVDKEFAKRLEQACERHVHAPSLHGRQKWVREKLLELGVKVSPEATSKWFGGEARPRPDTMGSLARVLEVDEAWLSLGITPELNQSEKRLHSALATGAVNLVAGLIQMAGGTIAFPERDTPNVDVLSIIKGKQRSLQVRVPVVSEGGKLRFIVHEDITKSEVIGVVPTKNELSFNFIAIPTSLIEAHGTRKGSYVEVHVDVEDKVFSIAGNALAVIKSFSNLDGVLPKGA